MERYSEMSKNISWVRKNCIAENAFQQLGDCHGEIKIGEWEQEKEADKCKEKIKWWTMDKVNELVSKL